jgi:hypothetical protein
MPGCIRAAWEAWHANRKAKAVAIQSLTKGAG